MQVSAVLGLGLTLSIGLGHSLKAGLGLEVDQLNKRPGCWDHSPSASNAIQRHRVAASLMRLQAQGSRCRKREEAQWPGTSLVRGMCGYTSKEDGFVLESRPQTSSRASSCARNPPPFLPELAILS